MSSKLNTSYWLQYAGAMSKIIAAKDGSLTLSAPTKLGRKIGGRPIVSLSSNFPQATAMGPEGTHKFYDGLWPLCFGKHLHLMGQDCKEY